MTRIIRTSLKFFASIRACRAVAAAKADVSRAQTQSKSVSARPQKPSRRGDCSPELFPRGNQFLEPRVFAQWFKHWIEPQQGRSERRVCRQRPFIWDRK